MKFSSIIKITILLSFVGILFLNGQETETGRALTEKDKQILIDHTCGVWMIEKRIFANGEVLTAPDVRGFLIITADYWTQIEAQIVEKNGVKPFSGSYYGATDSTNTRSIEKVFLTINTSLDKDNIPKVNVKTEESVQKTVLVINSDSVTQKFDGGGEVTMKDGRFSQKRGDLYTTYWVRIQKPEEVFKVK
jgi:hypothetical protein